MPKPTKSFAAAAGKPKPNKPSQQRAIVPKPQQRGNQKKKHVEVKEEDDEEIESSSDDDDEEEDEEDDDDDDEEEEEEEDNTVHLQSLAAELYPEASLAPHKPRKQVKANPLPGKESEFTASRHASASSSSGKLQLVDLLDDEQVNQGLIKKHMSTRHDHKILLQPLGKQVDQTKAERKLGYATASEQVTDKWQDLVVANKHAKLQFPLQEHVERTNIRSVVGGSKSTVSSALEDQVAAVLQASGLASEKDIIESEELARNEHASSGGGTEMDDTAKAKMRALLFYAEQKSKRVAKIKSKTFRKLRKRKLAREEEEALEKLRETDPELAKEEDERQAMLRAKERASLRQKNTSKRMRELGKRNKGAGEEQALKSKMRSLHDRNEDGEGSSGDDDDSDDDSDDGVDAEELARRHLASFEASIQHSNKGLAGMKFMQRAVDREHLQAKEEAVALLKRLRGGDDDEDGEEETGGLAATQELPGRRQFGGGDKNNKLMSKVAAAAGSKLFEEVAVEVKAEDEIKPAAARPAPVAAPEVAAPASKRMKPTEAADDGDASASSNPWLVNTSTSLRHKTSSSAAAAAPAMQVSQVIHSLPAASASASAAGGSDEQRELVKRAFASVAEEDFAREQDALEAAEEAKLAEPAAGAGWGSWTGLGVKVREPPAALPPAAQPKAKKAARANVIVSHRTNRLQRKYQVEDVPYPFTSREQYERSLRDAVGVEWNTVQQHEKKIRPQVQVKAGTIIQPLQAPSKAEQETKRQQKEDKAKATPYTHHQRDVMPKKRKFASRKAMS